MYVCALASVCACVYSERAYDIGMTTPPPCFLLSTEASSFADTTLSTAHPDSLRDSETSQCNKKRRGLLLRENDLYLYIGPFRF